MSHHGTANTYITIIMKYLTVLFYFDLVKPLIVLCRDGDKIIKCQYLIEFIFVWPLQLEIKKK